MLKPLRRTLAACGLIVAVLDLDPQQSPRSGATVAPHPGRLRHYDSIGEASSLCMHPGSRHNNVMLGRLPDPVYFGRNRALFAADRVLNEPAPYAAAWSSRSRARCTWWAALACPVTAGAGADSDSDSCTVALVDKNRRFREPGIASILILLSARLGCRDLLLSKALRRISFYTPVRCRLFWVGT